NARAPKLASVQRCSNVLDLGRPNVIGDARMALDALLPPVPAVRGGVHRTIAPSASSSRSCSSAPARHDHQC
ncbi:MAG: hypothetical protein ACREQ5_05270, partial [Candidatus Dormibacteria bacterium]